MARTERNQRSAGPPGGAVEGRKPPSSAALLLLLASALTAIWAAAMLTTSGRTIYASVFYFMEFYAGVFVLVSLTMTVVGGLLATDRIILKVHHRVLLQSTHRVTAVLAVAFLVVHIFTKISLGKAAPIDAAVPFITYSGLYVGLGTVASFLLLTTFWSGIIRARFVGVGPPWLWRALHSAAYLSWPIASCTASARGARRRPG